MPSLEEEHSAYIYLAFLIIENSRNGNPYDICYDDNTNLWEAAITRTSRVFNRHKDKSNRKYLTEKIIRKVWDCDA